MKTALIFGITGQSGSYLAELLLEKGYEVHGVIRRSSNYNTQRIDHIFDKLQLHYGDLADGTATAAIVDELQVDELYLLSAQSHVKVSFEIPEYTIDIGTTGVVKVFEAVRMCSPHTKVYNAASSEMFGATPPPQNENSPFDPQSPYACAKVFSYHLTRNYRKAYGLFMSNGILMNHESSRRGENFVTRKITRAVSRIHYGLQSKLYLGNLDAQRDWGHAKDYMIAAHMILQHNEPDDFVVATGIMRSVRDFAKAAFEFINKDYRDYVEIDKKYFRPSEVDALQGDASKAKQILGWEPKISFNELVTDMMTADLRDAWFEKERKDKESWQF